MLKFQNSFRDDRDLIRWPLNSSWCAIRPWVASIQLTRENFGAHYGKFYYRGFLSQRSGLPKT